jgi:hypothetical protein
MLKRLCLALAGLFALVSIAQGAGTVPGFSLSPQFDLTGHIAPGCKLYIIQAGTTSTPQNAYQDSALTLLQPNPMTCDAAGRMGQFFVADGTIKLRLTDRNGVQIFVGDNLLVVGPSSGGGGGGGTVDPTTIASTGDLKYAYGAAVLSGWVRANGRTIGSATSAATERANADCQALFTYLWNADNGTSILTISGGRGASAAADWAANKTISLPDARGRTMAGLGDMGSTDNGLLSGLTWTAGSSTILGSSVGAARRSLLTANLPPYTPGGSVSTTINLAGTTGIIATQGVPTGAAFNAPVGGGITWQSVSSMTFTGNPQGGTNSPFDAISPFILMTVYLKL